MSELLDRVIIMQKTGASTDTIVNYLENEYKKGNLTSRMYELLVSMVLGQ